jgi:FkbM family methyltransferase
MYPDILARLSRFYPLFSGNYSLVNSSKLSWIFSSNNKELAWCPSPGGPLLVPLDDDVGRCIFFTGDYDRKITWLCRRFLGPGDTALDIGANLGVVTLAMAKLVGSSGRVHAFEPNPHMQGLLKQSIGRSYRNIVLHETALGSEEGELELYVPPANVGAGSFVNHRDALHAEIVRCTVRRLTDVVKDEKIERIRLIKIDVEGFENEVLRGADDVLSDIRPDAIVLETNQVVNLPFRECPPIATLLRHKYRFLSIPKAVISMAVREFDLEQHGAPSHDVLAIPAELYDSTLRMLNNVRH